MNRISIGTNQAFNLNPGKFSYDLDNILDGMSMNYSFYCRVSDSGKNYTDDLMTIKNENISLTNADCFTSSGKLDKNKFNINNFILLFEIEMKMDIHLMLLEKY
jgi:hypothetical protein